MEAVGGDNSTGNVTSQNSICPQHQETVATQTVKTLAYSVIILLSLAGNSIVIVTVWRNISMRSVTNLFIANLAASDLLITFLGMPNMITQVYLGFKWIFGEALCKLVVFFQSVSVASSILTLLAISFDRFWAIIFPFKRRITFFSARIILGVIWGISLLVMAPFLYAQRVIVGPDGYKVCMEEWSPAFNNITAPKDYTLILFTTLYIFPLLTMVILYSFIVSKLWRRQIPGFRSNRDELRTRVLRQKVVKMLITVISLFCICWLPLYVYHFLYFFASAKRPCFDSSFTFYFASLFLGHSNSAINPFLYALFHRKYRQGFKAAYTCSVIPADSLAFTSRTYSRRRSSTKMLGMTLSYRSTAKEVKKRKFSTVVVANGHVSLRRASIKAT
ncbi:QRFP-like peptide receptor [Montipora foliosa]|uniref:QRFP-like peptide receptor n=1 Tax=Montipora foliosa TaxID=591990 RepID=UPI0035F19DF6